MEDRRSPKKESRRSGSSPEADPVTFDHDRVKPTPRRSQKRLFASRRRQAKRQRRSERRRKRMRVFILPLVFVGVFAVFGAAILLNWYRSNREADEKLARDAATYEQREQQRKAMEKREAAATLSPELEEARKRFLLRDSTATGGGTPGSAEKEE